MIKDPNFKIAIVRNRTYAALHKIFEDRGYSLSKKLDAKKNAGNNFLVKINVVDNNYSPHFYKISFHGSIAQRPLLDPMKLLFESIERDIGLKGVNNYQWSNVFSMGDFYPELQEEYRAIQTSKSFQFDSQADLEDSLIEMAHILIKQAFPTLEILLDFEKMKANLPHLINIFRDTYLNIYSFLVFSALFDQEHFENTFVQVTNAVAQIKNRGDQWNVFFDHLDYVKQYLNAKYLTNRVG